MENPRRAAYLAPRSEFNSYMFFTHPEQFVGGSVKYGGIVRAYFLTNACK